MLTIRDNFRQLLIFIQQVFKRVILTYCHAFKSVLIWFYRFCKEVICGAYCVFINVLNRASGKRKKLNLLGRLQPSLVSR